MPEVIDLTCNTPSPKPSPSPSPEPLPAPILSLLAQFEALSDRKWHAFDDLFADVHAVARLIGFFITKRRPSNYRGGTPRRYDLICSEGYERTPTSSGKRHNAKSWKPCMRKAKAVVLQAVGAWKSEVIHNVHSHECKPAQASYLPGHRRLGRSEDVIEKIVKYLMVKDTSLDIAPAV